MRWLKIINVVAVLSLALGCILFLPLLCSLIYNDSGCIPIVKSILATISISGAIAFVLRKERFTDYISPREGMAIVALGWTFIGIFGALPFYFSPSFLSFTDAFFESVSGFTTTGSSIMTNIQGASYSILFWRSLIQWLGGMGIIVLSLAILPFLGVGGMQLYKAEVPSPVPDKLKPRLRETAILLWEVYVLITVFQVLLLKIGGMSFFDSLCHTFTTMPTGGFSTKNLSVAAFDSVYMDVVIIIFMVIAGINFSLHYQFLKGDTLAFWKDTECRFFIGMVIILSVAVSFNIFGTIYHSIGDALRYGTFQVVSIVTTTGYATADYELWPGFSQMILFLCMFIGASAGSTGGGFKCIRVILCVKYCYREIFLMLHPRSVSQIKIAGKTVPEEVMKSIIGFMFIYLGVFAIASVILSGMGVDYVTAFTAVGSCIGNVGPGFGLVGPTENFSMIPATGKWLLIWCMLLGRLEVYTIIIFLVPEFWRK